MIKTGETSIYRITFLGVREHLRRLLNLRKFNRRERLAALVVIILESRIAIGMDQITVIGV